MIYIIHCVGLDMKRNTIDDFFTPTVVSGYTKMFGRLEDAKKYVEKIKQNLYFDACIYTADWSPITLFEHEYCHQNNKKEKRPWRNYITKRKPSTAKKSWTN